MQIVLKATSEEQLFVTAKGIPIPDLPRLELFASALSLKLPAAVIQVLDSLNVTALQWIRMPVELRLLPVPKLFLPSGLV